MIYKYKNKEYDIETERIDPYDQFYTKFVVYVDGQYLNTISLNKYMRADYNAQRFATNLDTLLDELI